MQDISIINIYTVGDLKENTKSSRDYKKIRIESNKVVFFERIIQEGVSRFRRHVT